MKNIFVKVTKKFSLLVLIQLCTLGIASQAIANEIVGKSASGANQCPAIDCDCASLPAPNWVQVCQQYEAYIKQECVKNFNTPKDYCSVHGENAKPVALSLALPSVTAKNISATDEAAVESYEEKLNASLWSLKADLASAQKMISKEQYSAAVKTLKLIDNNLDLVLVQNQQRLLAVKEYEDLSGDDWEKRKEKLWLSFAEQLAESAKMLDDFASQRDVQLQTSTTPKQVKVNKVFATVGYRVAGKAYEEVAYAYGQAGKHVVAANTWSRAADLSVHLSALTKEEKKDLATATYTELQSAARMYRASYHWMMSDSAYDANLILARSQNLVESEEQKKIQLLIDGSENVVSKSNISSR